MHIPAAELYKIDEPMDPDSAEYVGCFADDQADRLMTHEIKFRDDMTQAVCREHCEQFDSLFYATQVPARRLVRLPVPTLLRSVRCSRRLLSIIFRRRRGRRGCAFLFSYPRQVIISLRGI